MMRSLQLMLVTILAATSATSAQAQPRAAGTPAASRAERSFERLKSLVGTWRGAWSDGRPVGLTYRLSADGRWWSRPGR
jgi:hypothetical protein